MQLILRILSYRNQPLPPSAAGRFGMAGGTVGRSPDNALVLDDPGKYISRVHARVLFQDGGYYLEDVGSNPSVVNDRPLGKGRQVMLGHGDRITIGDYQLQGVIEEDVVAAPLLPPAPLNNPDLPLFEPPPPPPPVQLPPLEPVAKPAAAPAYNAALPDALAGASILDMGGAQLGGGDDPLGLNLFGGAAPAAPPRAAESDHVSPEFAAFQRAPFGAAPAAPAPAAFAPAAPMASPAFAQPRQSPSGAFAIPDDYDPLADLFPRAPAPAAPVAAPALFAEETWLAPAAAPAAAETPSLIAVPEPQPIAAVAEPMPSFAAAPAPAPFEPAPPLVVAAPPPKPAAAPPAAPPAAARAAAAPVAAASDSEVLQALLRGLGLPDLKTSRPATEIAETVGAMLREATNGTIDVLMARALTKKESRIDMTMLSVRANNPLKFFPNADGALTQMLTGAMAGYMPPVQAMSGAFDDLRAHELAVIAGMRAALAAVLHRFDPAKIEQRLAVPTVFDKMMSANRKAKMWDRLVELYGEIAREADDDLQRLFGEKFSEAYEEQVERLRQAKKHGA